MYGEAGMYSFSVTQPSSLSSDSYGTTLWKKFTMLLLEWKPSNSYVWNNSTDEVELTTGLSSIPQGRGVV